MLAFKAKPDARGLTFHRRARHVTHQKQAPGARFGVKHPHAKLHTQGLGKCIQRAGVSVSTRSSNGIGVNRLAKSRIFENLRVGMHPLRSFNTKKALQRAPSRKVFLGHIRLGVAGKGSGDATKGAVACTSALADFKEFGPRHGRASAGGLGARLRCRGAARTAVVRLSFGGRARRVDLHLIRGRSVRSDATGGGLIVSKSFESPDRPGSGLRSAAFGRFRSPRRDNYARSENRRPSKTSRRSSPKAPKRLAGTGDGGNRSETSFAGPGLDIAGKPRSRGRRDAPAWCQGSRRFGG